MITPTIKRIIEEYSKSYYEPHPCQILNNSLKSILNGYKFECKETKKGSKLTIEIKIEKQ